MVEDRHCERCAAPWGTACMIDGRSVIRCLDWKACDARVAHLSAQPTPSEMVGQANDQDMAWARAWLHERGYSFDDAEPLADMLHFMRCLGRDEAREEPMGQGMCGNPAGILGQTCTRPSGHTGDHQFWDEEGLVAGWGNHPPSEGTFKVKSDAEALRDVTDANIDFDAELAYLRGQGPEPRAEGKSTVVVCLGEFSAHHFDSYQPDVCVRCHFKRTAGANDTSEPKSIIGQMPVIPKEHAGAEGTLDPDEVVDRIVAENMPKATTKCVLERRSANPYPGDEARVRKWFDEEDGGTYLEGVARLIGVFAEVRADERQRMADASPKGISAEHHRRSIQQARDEGYSAGLEEAAKACDAQAYRCKRSADISYSSEEWMNCATDMAERIRALATPHPLPEEKK